jgi:DNA invertase Pin-like site-specific DNA recombinase
VRDSVASHKKKPAGEKLVFHVVRSLAQFERSLIVEHTKAGLDASKRRGEYPGRPKLLSSQQIKHARKMLDRGEETNESVAALFDVDRTTI